jgi:hypothetical protein
LAATCLKEIIVNHWSKIELQDRVQIKEYLMQFLVLKGCQCEHAVLKMIMMMLAKITKKAWFEQPELQNIVVELLGMCAVSPKHLQIGM